MQTPAWSLAGYDVEELLGYGSAGELWRARESRTGAAVALKRLRTGTDPAARDRIRRDAARLAAFRHPNVVALHSVVGASDGVVLILEHVAGCRLDSLLAQRGRLRPGEAVTVVAPLCGALAAAHDRGLRHGNLTAADVLVDLDGRPVLADLGLLQLVGDPGLPQTLMADAGRAGAPAGFPGTAADDVQALLAICWQLLTGRRPPDGRRPDGGPSASELLGAAPDIPPPLAHALVAGLAADPAARPTPAALGRSLLAGAPAEPLELPPVDCQEFPSRPPVAAVAPPAPVEAPLAVESRLGAGGADASDADRQTARGRPPARAVRLAGVAVLVTIAAVALGWRLAPREPPAAGVALAVAAPGASGTAAVPTGTGVWAAVVSDLDERRDRAVGHVDPAGVADVDERGSPAADADMTLVDQLQSAGAHAEHLAHTVRSVSLVGAEPTAVTLRVVDAMPAYELVAAADGAVLVRRPARPHAGWLVHVVRQHPGADGWRFRLVEREPVSGG